MAKARISATAAAEMEEIWMYIAADDIGAADRTLKKLLGAINSLARRPGMGRTRDDVQPGVRSWPVGSYVIYYMSSDPKRYLDVLHVAHGARSTDRLFPRSDRS